jgi:hypothetical protein
MTQPTLAERIARVTERLENAEKYRAVWSDELIVLEALLLQNKRLRDACSPFVAASPAAESETPDDHLCYVTAGDLRRLAQVLSDGAAS